MILASLMAKLKQLLEVKADFKRLRKDPAIISGYF